MQNCTEASPTNHPTSSTSGAQAVRELAFSKEQRGQACTSWFNKPEAHQPTSALCACVLFTNAIFKARVTALGLRLLKVKENVCPHNSQHSLTSRYSPEHWMNSSEHSAGRSHIETRSPKAIESTNHRTTHSMTIRYHSCDHLPLATRDPSSQSSQYGNSPVFLKEHLLQNLGPIRSRV